MVQVHWKGAHLFEAVPPTGNKFVMDAHPELGGQNMGPTPLEAFLGAAAACSAMDVLIILQKKQQKVTSYRVEIEGERGPEGQYPRPFLNLTVRHIVSGEDLDPAAVARAVELSDQKYCTVLSTLRHRPEVNSVWEISS